VREDLKEEFFGRDEIAGGGVCLTQLKKHFGHAGLQFVRAL
jgi:hypothetical protein